MKIKCLDCGHESGPNHYKGTPDKVLMGVAVYCPECNRKTPHESVKSEHAYSVCTKCGRPLPHTPDVCIANLQHKIILLDNRVKELQANNKVLEDLNKGDVPTHPLREAQKDMLEDHEVKEAYVSIEREILEDFLKVAANADAMIDTQDYHHGVSWRQEWESVLDRIKHVMDPLTTDMKFELNALDYDELLKDYDQICRDAEGDQVEPETIGEFAHSHAHGIVTCKYDTVLVCTAECEQAAGDYILEKLLEHMRGKGKEKS